MGINSSRGHGIYDPMDSRRDGVSDRPIYEFGTCKKEIVHHYLPSNLPMNPIITEAYVTDCQKAWKLIQTGNTDRMQTFDRPGMVLFYDELTFRLTSMDASFEPIFNNAVRGVSIIVKSMAFILGDSEIRDESLLADRARYLGLRHRSFEGVRAHQFSIYVLKFIEVIMYWLGGEATPTIGEAWSHVFCFYLKHMLEAYLHHRTYANESNQSMTSDSDYSKDIEDVASARQSTRSSGREQHTNRLTSRTKNSIRNSARSNGSARSSAR